MTINCSGTLPAANSALAYIAGRRQAIGTSSLFSYSPGGRKEMKHLFLIFIIISLISIGYWLDEHRLNVSHSIYLYFCYSADEL